MTLMIWVWNERTSAESLGHIEIRLLPHRKARTSAPPLFPSFSNLSPCFPCLSFQTPVILPLRPQTLCPPVSPLPPLPFQRGTASTNRALLNDIWEFWESLRMCYSNWPMNLVGRPFATVDHCSLCLLSLSHSYFPFPHRLLVLFCCMKYMHESHPSRDRLVRPCAE